MGFLDGFFGIFRRKKEEPAKETPLTAAPYPLTAPTAETTTIDNVKAKMDLVLTELDSIRTQYQVLSGKVSSIEKMVKELYDMAKS